MHAGPHGQNRRRRRPEEVGVRIDERFVPAAGGAQRPVRSVRLYVRRLPLAGDDGGFDRAAPHASAAIKGKWRRLALVDPLELTMLRCFAWSPLNRWTSAKS